MGTMMRHEPFREVQQPRDLGEPLARNVVQSILQRTIYILITVQNLQPKHYVLLLANRRTPLLYEAWPFREEYPLKTFTSLRPKVVHSPIDAFDNRGGTQMLLG